MLLTACGSESEPGAEVADSTDGERSVVTQDSPGYDFDYPHHFPEPEVPADNLLTVEKIELGRMLFFDRNMSWNQERSCGDCHQPALAFTDGQVVSVGTDETQIHPRNAMSLTNVVYNAGFNWANPNVFDLETQAHGVLFNETPVELGWADYEQVILDRFREDENYRLQFALAFDEEEPITIQNVKKALASFQRRLISGASAFDKFETGNEEALSASAKRGLALFFSEQLECFHCHGGFNFSQSVDHVGQVFNQLEFHNNGLYNIGGTGNYPADNTGLWEFISEPQNMGRFRAPTLRNIALTAPYMHDGSIETLRDVVEHYSRGGRLIEDGPFAGDGADSDYKSDFVIGFVLDEQGKADLIAFLESLTDWEFICREELQDPFGIHPPHANCQ